MRNEAMWVGDHLSTITGIHSGDICFEDSITLARDVPGVVENYTEWMDRDASTHLELFTTPIFV